MATFTFEEDVKNFVLGDIQRYVSQNALVELQGMDCSQILMPYYNWRLRFIEPRPRAVDISNELSLQIYNDPTYRDIISVVQTDFEEGNDLTPRLSRRVFNQRNVYVPGSASSSIDRDFQLNAWGIFHLHLGLGPCTQGPDLLNVFISREQACLINISSHNFLAREHLITMHNNWPNVATSELFGVLSSPSESWTDEEIFDLTLAGGLAPITLNDGRVIVPIGNKGSVLTSSGYNTYCVDKRRDLLIRLNHLRESIESQLQNILGQLNITPNDAIFSLTFNGRIHSARIFETTTQRFIGEDNVLQGLYLN